MNDSIRADGRTPHELRPVTIERGFVRHAAGSALFAAGNTRIICTASILPGVPPWLEGTDRGWATGEYSMLPAATRPRHGRDGRRGPPSGRSVEIQRIIGRSIRAVLDLKAIAGLTVHVDCDVVDADGSTRAAAITGAYVALVDAVASGREEGLVPEDPIRDQIAAVSVGVVDGTPLVDLTYEEDCRAAFDFNLAVCASGGIVEAQGTAEGPPLPRERFDALVNLGLDAARRLLRCQDAALGR
jgi:ribonuclease PH